MSEPRRALPVVSVVVLAIASGGLACGTTPPDPSGQPRSASDPLDDAAGDLVARPPSRGKVRGGERMRRTVTWPEADTRSVEAYESLDARSREAVDLAPVPVLVPALAEALDERKVMQGPEWAAFWGRRETAESTVTITVNASRMARVYPGVTPKPGPHTLRGKEAFVSRNEGIWSATWIEHGVAYDLGLECAPVDAPPCDDQAGVEALAEGLVYVGGRGPEPKQEQEVER
ncbi:hypothetical protein [Paraliomyxa miuraensis]|uniref:hypothetical protein n=1 Tax=Paraliomyxa miuraensis TaxID=376150 RepID=UPI00224E421E|nr:hypothetical protein [Paraliomyxa miuraensis]MCX4246194.1 hypothetical protein [Paraliomyxa miuraensis]